MEDIKEYIASGILELYVLGDVSPDEKLQVEAMAAEHSDIKAELGEIEKSMELYAESYAVEPPETLRMKVMNSMIVNLGDDRTFTKARNHTEEVFEDDLVKADNVVNMPLRQSNFFKYAFAACLTLLLISIYGLINLNSRLHESNSQVTAMLLDKQKVANQVNLKDEQLDLYRDPVFKVLKLKGTAKTPASAMTLAWNTTSKKVLLDLNSLKLPDTDKKHQYQLWALVGGKPVDLGVFDGKSTVDTSGVKEMKAIAAADAFAVTIEPTGGSINPTISEMVVSGTAN